MSIKVKLTVCMSILVAFILTLNISIYYYTSRAELEDGAKQQMLTIAEQISTSVEVSQRARQYMEDTIGEQLRSAAIAAKYILDPDIANVTNEQLAGLTGKLGVDHISLWTRQGDDIIITKSSDPKEINLSSKSWDYWHTAFQQLFDGQNVTIPQGQKLPDYWSGPVNYASSDPSKINKWGNYYDGTTNYMINPYVNANPLFDFQKTTGTEAIVKHMADRHPNIVEITGFNPEFFGKQPIIKMKQGIPVYNLDVRDVIFGEYTYKDGQTDAANIQRSVQLKQIVTTEAEINGKQIIKSFIPVMAAAQPYVIGINFDRTEIDQVLNHQLFLHCMISLGLLLITTVVSYFLAGVWIRPIRQILGSVNEAAAGNFGTLINTRRKDELGLLSSRVNTMTVNLSNYTSKLKEAAEELRDTKEYLESFVNHTSDAIHVSDLQGNVTQVNKAFETLFGWGGHEAIGRSLPLVPEQYQKEYDHKVQCILQGESVTDYETVHLTKDGQLIDVSITISPIRNEAGEVVAIASITRNITMRKQTEDFLRRSEKLSVVGQLAAGVAHEIRNPLTTLRGFVQLHQLKGTLQESHLNVMLSELDRINFIVSEFLVLAKPQASHFQLSDIGQILNDIGLLLEPQAIMSNIRIETIVGPDILLLHCEVNQLKQVFINVLKNAMEAMPDGGTILIEAERPAHGHIVVRITDQGCGIPEQDLNRIGEPFFTNKENGNGLGLMVSQRIINNHKGSISIQSKPGEGTCLEIKLPAS